MKKRIDNLGRLVIPEPFRYELGIYPNDEIEIEMVGNKVVISNPKGMRSKEEIEKMYKDIRNLENRGEYDKGFEDALKFILRKESE